MPEDHMDQLYCSKNPLVRYVHNNRLLNLAHRMPAKSGLTVLDAGCGEGHLLKLLHSKRPDNSYFGVDITEEALAKARLRCPFADIKKEDISKLSIASNSIDVVMCTEVIEHIFNYQDVLNEFTRVLRPGGILLITFPNEINWRISRFLLRRNPIIVPDHVNSFNPKTMKNALYLNYVTKKNLPFPFPFYLSLGTLMKFKKMA